MSTKWNEPNNRLDGYAVWSWPEFQAFAKRLGIEPRDRIKAITIRLALDETVSITQEYIGADKHDGPQEIA